MEEDAKRRDFTINALFYDSQREELIDFVAGLKDLQNKILRTVGKPEKRFKEDHLRVLRTLRLAHQLGFQIDEETKKALPVFTQKIKTISRERVLEETIKMFSVGRIGSALKSLKEYAVFQFVFPGLTANFKSPYLKNPFDFWNKNFSSYTEQAFFWTSIGLPFFLFGHNRI